MEDYNETCERSLREQQLEEKVKVVLKNGLALATTGAASGVAITKLTGHSKTLGAVVGVGLNLVLFGILSIANRKQN